MVYIVFEEHTGEMVAAIYTDLGKEVTAKGFSVLKGDLYDILIPRPWEHDFPDEFDRLEHEPEQ